VALATVIAAGTLSTALAQKIQQQTEDVVPAAASFVANDDYWINPSPPLATVNFVSRPYTFDAVEIVPPAHPPFVPDEDFWPALLAPAGQPPATLLSRQPFAFDVQELVLLPSSQIDEDYWVPSRAFQTVGYQWLIIAQEQADVVSAPQVFHPDEDYWQFPPALASFRYCHSQATLKLFSLRPLFSLTKITGLLLLQFRRLAICGCRLHRTRQSLFRLRRVLSLTKTIGPCSRRRRKGSR
jgi:hypothetical protein